MNQEVKRRLLSLAIVITVCLVVVKALVDNPGDDSPNFKANHRYLGVVESKVGDHLSSVRIKCTCENEEVCTNKDCKEMVILIPYKCTVGTTVEILTNDIDSFMEGRKVQ